MINVLLTVPHGNLKHNDVVARPVAEVLHMLLKDAGYHVVTLVNDVDRIHTDQNRREGRGTKFREDITRQIRSGVELLIDVHSFPQVGGSGRFTDKDIVLLYTRGIQDLRWLRKYANLLDRAAKTMKRKFSIEIQPSERVNDINIEAIENGQPPDSLMLAEHNESGDEFLYASLHFHAIQTLLGKPKR